MIPYPLCLSGIYKTPIWGGTQLIQELGKHSPAPTLGESWELSVRKNEQNTVCNGVLAGKRVTEALAALGFAPPSGFPLLVKLIDAADRLSVQVHPSDAYAMQHEHGESGKSELWYIVAAAPGAEIVYGTQGVPSRQDLAAAIEQGRLEPLLHRQPVHAGESYFIPAGLLHAIGGGILIAEIQQSSNLTYRVYDYGRRDQAGHLRQLHIEKALDVIRPFSAAKIEMLRFAKHTPSLSGGQVLADCAYFRAEQLQLNGFQISLPYATGWRHLLCLSGRATLSCNGVDYAVSPMEGSASWLLPPSVPLHLSGNASLLFSAPTVDRESTPTQRI